MSKNKKLLELYAKTSTPQELFVDAIEKINVVEHKVETVEKTLDTTLQFALEHKPTSEEDLIVMIHKMMPKPIPGKPGKNAKQPTSEELTTLIKPLIPEPLQGSPDTPEEIRDKIKSLEGTEKLSVLDLKDTEWLRGAKETFVQGNIVGGILSVIHDATLSGDGTTASPLSVIGGGGGGNWTPLGVTTITAGGITVGTNLGLVPVPIQTTLRQILYPAIAPGVTLASNPVGGIKEEGDWIISVDLSATTVKHSNPITSVKFYRNGLLIYTVPLPNPAGGIETYTDIVPIIANTAYTCVVGDGTMTTTSNIVTFTFVNAYYYGVDLPGLDISADGGGLSKLVIGNTPTLSELFSPTNEVYYFAYPDGYPALTSILDKNGFETISDYTVTAGIGVTNSFGDMTTYWLYEFDHITTQVAFKNTFTQ